MMRRIGSLLRKETIKALRDNIVLYGALSPILLALVLGLLIPDMEGMKVTVAVEKGVETRLIEGLTNYAEVEILETRDGVRKRVEKNDDIAGIVRDNGQYVVLLEGNEAGEAEEIASTLLNMILSGEPMSEYRHESLGATNSRIREILGALILLTATLIGGFIVGFGIVDEKETKMVHALSVSPMRLREFILSHALFCAITSVILAVLSGFVFARTSISYWMVVVSMLSAVGVGLLLGFLIGGLADNLISAIAVVKFLMLAFMGIPIASLFTPDKFHWIFYPFPNYWAYQSCLKVFDGGNQAFSFAVTNGITILLSLAVLALLVPVLNRKLNFR
jgi:ABC-2 type transport system permease protein